MLAAPLHAGVGACDFRAGPQIGICFSERQEKIDATPRDGDVGIIWEEVAVVQSSLTFRRYKDGDNKPGELRDQIFRCGQVL